MVGLVAPARESEGVPFAVVGAARMIGLLEIKKKTMMVLSLSSTSGSVTSSALARVAAGPLLCMQWGQ